MPAAPHSTNRHRHLATVGGDTPNWDAIWVLNAPGSAQTIAIRHRDAYACVDVAARAPRTNFRP
ncbi:hypothetical protein OIE68_00835 [Nocardia vinacea]|uniref:hypothetical protein n=1 Tax=Nocardia vinacea TaxID=96468 RepID=UPI002E125C5B|nr:hypothetical protein OIE68_00835 [Nocardia vinacea]